MDFDLADVVTEIALDSAPGDDPQIYTDVSSYVRSIETRHGRRDPLSRVEASSLLLRLDDRTRRFFPRNASGPHYGKLKANRRVRVRYPEGGWADGGDLTLSGNEITDALRAAAVHGDGRSWPAIEFYGDFESGNELEWDALEVFSAPDQFAIATTPLRDGIYAARFTVRSGDTVSGGERSEVRRSTGYAATNPALDGVDACYAWSTLFPAGWTHTTNWQIFHQHHSDARFNQAPFMFRVGTGVNEGKLELRAVSGNYASAGDAAAGTNAGYDETYTLRVAPLEEDEWHDFRAKFKWRTDTTGSVEVWLRVGGGEYEKVVDAQGVQTIPTITGDPTAGQITDKLGLYRNNSAFTSVIYHDGYRVGHSLEDVAYDAPRDGADSSFGIYAAHTNIIENSGAETNLDGTGNAGAGITRTRDSAWAKFGSWAFKAACDGTSSGQGYFFNKIDGTRFAVTAGLPYTTSGWVRGVTDPNGLVRIGIEWWDASPAVISTSFTTGRPPRDPGERIAITATAPVGAVTARVRISTTTTVALDFWADGVDFKQKAYATPHVHTDGAAATRSAGRVRGPAALLDETQGWVAARVRMGFPSAAAPHASGNPHIFGWGDDANNALIVTWMQSPTNTWLVRRRSGGTGPSVSVADTFAAGDYVTVIARWEAGRVGLSIDGAAFVNFSGANIPTLSATQFDIGNQDVDNTQPLESDILWFATGAGALTDADAATIHAFADRDVPPTLFEWPEMPLLVWAANDAEYWVNGDGYLFSGFVDGYWESWPGRGFDAETVIRATDGFKALARYSLPTTAPPRDSYADVVLFDKPYLYARMGDEPGSTAAQAVVGEAGIPGSTASRPTFGADGAIIGDYDGAVDFPANRTLFWGNGDPFKWPGASKVGIEIWAKVLSQGAGSAHLFESTPHGSGPDFALHLDSSLVPQFRINISGTGIVALAGTVLTVGDWTHLFATWDDTTMWVYQDGASVDSVAQGGTFSVETYTSPNPHVSTPLSGHTMIVDELAIYSHAPSAERVAAHYEAGASKGFGEELSGARVDAILDLVTGGWAAGDRDIDAGVRSVSGRRQRGQKALEEIRAVEEAEGGAFFFSRSGRPTYLDSGYQTRAPYSVSVATFGDALELDDVPIGDFEIGEEDSTVRNTFRVSREDSATVASATDATSETDHLEIPEDIGPLILADDADLQEIADERLEKYKQPFPYVPNLSFNLAKDPRLAVYALSLDMGRKIRVRRSKAPGGGDLTTLELRIQSVELNLRPGLATCTWGVAPANL